MKKIIIILQIIILSTFTKRHLHAQNVLAYAEMEAEKVNKLQVEGKFVNIHIQQGDKTHFVGNITGIGSTGDYAFDAKVSGSTLIIKIKVNKKTEWNWKQYNALEANINITVTEGIEMTIKNTSGNISISNLTANNTYIKTTSGNINLKNVKANIEMEATSGNTSINDFNGNLTTETTSGKQQLMNINGQIDTKSTSGDIKASDFNGIIEMETTSGNIELNNGKARVCARTTSGNVNGKNIELTDNACFFTSSGNVEIDFTNNVLELGFELKTSSGNLKVAEHTAEKKLYIGRGLFKVFGVTTSGDQTYN